MLKVMRCGTHNIAVQELRRSKGIVTVVVAEDPPKDTRLRLGQEITARQGRDELVFVTVRHQRNQEQVLRNMVATSLQAAMTFNAGTKH